MVHPETLEQLSERVEELEKRVTQLERRSTQSFESVEAPAAAIVERATAAVPEISAGTSLPVLGKALLGIAGAYLLRALSSYEVAFRELIAVLAAAYAVAWLVAGARAVMRNRLAGVLYTSTSLLIFAPMLWEMTLRFHAMPDGAALAVLAGYVVAIGVVARGPGCTAVFSIAYAGSAIAALSLAITTRAIAPFTVLLLAMVVWDEVAQFRGRERFVAPIVLLAADTAVWALLFIYRAPALARPEYPDLGSGLILAVPLLLFIVHAGGIAGRLRNPEFRISAFQIFQAMLDFTLAACGLTWLAPARAQVVLGALCVVLAGGCYIAALGPSRQSANARNSRVFAVWSAGLLLGGMYLLLPISFAGVALGFLSLAAAVAGRRLRCRVLVYHAMLYLIAGAIMAGLPQYVFQVLAGTMPGLPSLRVMLLSAAGIAVYVACEMQPDQPEGGQILGLIPALLSAFSLCALMTHAVVGVASQILTAGVPLIAFLRTLTVCLFAVVIAIAGSRLGRVVMKQVAYTLIMFAVAKLFFEDLRHEKLEFIAGSICLVAVTLILVPRLTGRAAQSPSAS